jgi:hypothetical protein
MPAMHPVVRFLGSSVTTALLLVGCGGAAGTPSAATSLAAPSAAPSVVSSPSIQVSPSVAPSASTAPSPSAADAAVPLCAKEMNPCPLTAGTYSAIPFTPTFEFTITDPWQNDRAWPDGGEIAKDSGAVQWASGVTTGYKFGLAGIATPIGSKPADFIDYLKSFKGFTVSDPIPVTIDGVSGQQVDVLTRRTAVHGIFVIAHDAFNLDAGEKIRFFVLDKDGRTVILTIDSFKAADFDAFAEVAQPVIDSITWVP